MRKILDYEYILQRFAEITIDAQGKKCKTYSYEKVMIPYEKLKSLPNVETYLKSGVTLAQLEMRKYPLMPCSAHAIERLKLKQHIHRTIGKLPTRFDVFDHGFGGSPTSVLLDGGHRGT